MSMRTALPVLALAVAVIVGCKEAERPAATPSASTPAPSPLSSVTLAPSDASKASMTTPGAPAEAGSAIGGTAAGNTTDPQPTGTGRGSATSASPPEPTGGDGSPQAPRRKSATNNAYA